MAKNVFNATLEPNNRIDVNAFDLSHTYHATFDQGLIYPVFWHRLPPKSSIRINMEAGIQQFQTVFPLQTSQRLRLNAFKVELRALDEDYMERVVNNSDTLEPYTAVLLKTGTLADYLGLPTTVPSNIESINTAMTLSGTAKEYEEGVKISITGSTGGLRIPNVKGSVVAFRLADIPSGSYPFEFVCIGVSSDSHVVSIDRFTITQSDDTERYISVQAGVDFYLLQGVSTPIVSGTPSFINSVYSNSVIFDNSDIGKKDDFNAYPFRAYEAIYNSFYRDTRNNPRIVNGKPVYNKWLPTMKSGRDDTYYTLRRCAWAPDAFTTAVPDPQQGIKAPLAGLTTYTKTTVLDNGEVEAKVATAILDEDGKAYGLDFKSNEDGTALTEVTYTELGADPSIQRINTLEDLVTQGLSIETLRNVNAYQKFLELNMRKGYLYKDIIQGRWDVSIRYDELLMPEFIGGMSRELNTNSVTQTVDNSTNGDYATALGSQAGISGVYGNMDGNIECFCDEESIVMVCLTITPLPIYTQCLPKQFRYKELLDSFQPEFDNIGFQPIMSEEVAYGVPGQSKTNIFGYQRPWYEYLWKPDTAHGDFRLSLRNFLMQRSFFEVPELSTSFLNVDPTQVNDVYAVSRIDDAPINDHYYGYIKFNITARMPITRVAIPRLD